MRLVLSAQSAKLSLAVEDDILIAKMYLPVFKLTIVIGLVSDTVDM